MGQIYTKIIYIIANFCVTVLNILSKDIISNNTKHRKQISTGFHWIPLNRLKDDLKKKLHT